MSMASNRDIRAFFEYDNKMRKKFGALRYFVYPFLLENHGDVTVSVKYADRREMHTESVCRSNCQLCDLCRPPPSPPLSRPLPVWREAVIRDPHGPRLLFGPARYKYAPTFGIFPHFHSGDGLMHIISLSHSPVVQGILHMTGSTANDLLKKEFFL